MKQLLESMCNGGFFHKPESEALEFLSSIVELTRGWEESLTREKTRSGPQHDNKRRVYHVNDAIENKGKSSLPTSSTR